MLGLVIWAALIMGPYLLPAVLAAGLVAALAGGRSSDDGRGRAAGWLALVLGVLLLGGMTVFYD